MEIGSVAALLEVENAVAKADRTPFKNLSGEYLPTNHKMEGITKTA